MAESVKIRILGDATGLTKALGVAESGLGKLGGVVSGFGKAAGAAMVAAGATAAAGFVNGFGDAMDRQALRSVVGDDILESSAASTVTPGANPSNKSPRSWRKPNGLLVKAPTLNN